jgi:hypothetical protein
MLSSFKARRQYLGDRLQERVERLLLTNARQGRKAIVADPVLAHRARVKSTAITAIRRYSPTPYAGRVCIFIPNKAWVRSGAAPLRWLQTVPHAEVYYGPDDCYGPFMLEDPNAPAIAELFRRSV